MQLSMLPEQIKITNEDIVYAENILLPKGKLFDIERHDFIKNLDTIDLQAVPGSGKTTALLAKLLILENYMPFDNGSGILVISHTNAAIDEIKNRIGKHCPKLFSYPNFIGTIQSFVDHFLAIPYYVNIYKKKPHRIDNETFLDRFNFKYPRNLRYSLEQRLNLKYNSFLLEIEIDEAEKIVNFISLENITIPRASENSETYKKLVDTKNYLIDNGFLNFNDAYFLANDYIQKFIRIKKFLQKRFRFVFVDEMQDMAKHQYDILEKLFYKKVIIRQVYQRIGDKNQAIYSSGNIETSEIWKNSCRKILKLKGSHRLSKKTANVVKYFGLDYLEIEGLNSVADIKPNIIVFDDPNEVLPKFTEIIKNYELDKIETDNKYPFHAIGWTTHKTEEEQNTDKIRIQDYHENYEKDEAKPKIDYKNLKSHLLFYDKEKPTLKPIRNNILNALIKIIRLEDKKDENGRDYKKNSFLKYLKNNNTEKYEELKLRIYEWSFEVKKGNAEIIFSELKDYIPIFLKDVFEINVLKSETQNFLNDEPSSESDSISNFRNINEKNNIYVNEDNGIEVKIGTVHSVKGKTHTATLYMECFYERDVLGGNYESQRLRGVLTKEKKVEDILNNDDLTDFKKKILTQTSKMVYVGFSRPTHLLCFAVHKDRLNADFENDNWEIINCN